jgi:hypothetical protein
MSGPGDEIANSASENRGLIPRLLESLFLEMGKRERASEEGAAQGMERIKYFVSIEFLEIYNEGLKDLLHSDAVDGARRELKIKAKPAVHVEGFQNKVHGKPLSSYGEAIKWSVVAHTQLHEKLHATQECISWQG